MKKSVSKWWDFMTDFQRANVLNEILGKPYSWQESNFESCATKKYSELTEYARKKIKDKYEGII